MPAAELGAALPLALIMTELWFVALGLAYFFAISRGRSNVARNDCLLLGTLLTCVYPAYGVGFSLALGTVPAGTPTDFEWVGGAFVMSLFSLSLTPFGLLCGWILWRVGVRPAGPKDMALVFD
jgi:hypothetical protein